jgi:hypothetical protein
VTTVCTIHDAVGSARTVRRRDGTVRRTGLKNRAGRGIRMPMKPSLVCLCAALVITISRSSLADDVDVLYDVDDLAMTSVHVTGNRRGVTLEAPIDGDWKTICNAPCDLLVPFGQYRLGGTGLRPTNVVELAPLGPTTLHGSMAPAGRLHTGVVLTIVGSSLLLVAGAFFTGAGLMSAQGGLGGDVGAAFLALIGAAHAAPGVGLLVPGAILWASGSSRVDVGEPQQVGVRFTMGGAKLAF